MHNTNNKRFAIVITHMGQHKGVVELPWLEADYLIDKSDWIVLSKDGWRAVADGDPTIWDALERKLLLGFYVNQPQLIAVIGHPSDANEDEEVQQRPAEVRQIVQRIQSLGLPAGVMGVRTDEYGALQEMLEPAECEEREPELQLMH